MMYSCMEAHLVVLGLYVTIEIVDLHSQYMGVCVCVSNYTIVINSDNI